MALKQKLKACSSMVLLGAIFIVSFKNTIICQHRYWYDPVAAPTCIYLTIDDGPSAASQYISNMAVTDSALMNMFVIGQRVFKNDSLHTLFNLYQTNPFIETGNHSYSHANSRYHNYYLHPQEVINDFILNADTLSLKNKIARLPGRNTWRLNGRKRTDLPDDSTAADTLAAQGYRVFGWDIEWRFTADSNRHVLPAMIFMNRLQNIIRTKQSFTPGHIVILCHESMFTDSSNRLQLDTLIRIIKQKNSCLLRHLSAYP